MYNKPLSTSARVRHPRWQQCQCTIRLPDDEVLGAGVTLYTDNRNDFTTAWVKRIVDPNVGSRKHGSVPLLRAAPARRRWALGLGLAACQKGMSVSFVTPPRWSTN